MTKYSFGGGMMSAMDIRGFDMLRCSAAPAGYETLFIRKY